MAHLFKVTLSPIALQSPGLDSVTFTAQCEGCEERSWSLSPYTVAGLLASRFSINDIVRIETRLHAVEPVDLPGTYNSMELVEMGYRLTKDAVK